MTNKYPEPGRKAQRQNAVLEALTSRTLGTQNDLVEVLRKRGIAATQVSVSRDIAELGVVKMGGVYKAGSAGGAAADPELPLRTWLRAVKPAGSNLVVLRCDSGTAQRVGIVIDELAWDGVVGTIAGDDTVFVAVNGAAACKRVAQSLISRMNRS